MRNFMMFALLAMAPEAMAIQAPPATVVAPTTATQWFVDADGDGFRDAKVVGSGSVAPKGAHAASAYPAAVDCDDSNSGAYPGATEEAADDGVDQDCNGGTESVVDDADVKSLASWTLGASVSRGPNLPAYPKVYGQVVACEKNHEWSVADGTCLCGAGHAWRAFQDTDGAWTGVCDAAHGASGNGGTYDAGARKAAADLRTEFEADRVANEAAHAGLQTDIDDAELAIDRLTSENKNEHAAMTDQIEELVDASSRLADNQTALATEVGRVKTSVLTEADLRKAMDNGLALEINAAMKKAGRFSFGLTAGGMLGGNTEVRWTEADLLDEKTGEVVEEGGGYLLRGVNSAGGVFDTRLGYRFWDRANLGVGLTATAIRETTQFKAGRSVGATGFDQIGRVTALYEPDLKKGSLGIGGGLGVSRSATAQGAAQCKVFGWAPVFVAEGVATFGESPMGLRLLVWGGHEKIGFTPDGYEDELQYNGATLGAALGLTVSR